MELGFVFGVLSLGYNSILDFVNLEESFYSLVESSIGFCYFLGVLIIF